MQPLTMPGTAKAQTNLKDLLLDVGIYEHANTGATSVKLSIRDLNYVFKR